MDSDNVTYNVDTDPIQRKLKFVTYACTLSVSKDNPLLFQTEINKPMFYPVDMKRCVRKYLKGSGMLYDSHN